MFRSVRAVVVGVGMLLGVLAFPTAGWAAPAGSVQLILPQSYAFSYLGHSCGGIQEQTYATGFDLVSGFPVGDVYASTSCGGSGRGGGYHSTTYSAWIAVTWDYAGSVVSTATAGTVSVDPGLVAYDSFGNEVSNQPPNAYLTLVAGFNPAPVLSGLSVTQGPASGGTSVVISGTGLGGATAVSFGGVDATVTSDGDRSITVTTPASSAGTVAVTVTTAGGTSAPTSFTFIAAPVVTGVTPDNGPLTGGTPVTITGSAFTNASLVLFGGIYAPFTVTDGATIAAVAPAGESVDTVGVTVTTLGGTSISGPGAQFTYNPVASPLAPTITKVSPAWGPPAGGTVVTITGTNFTGTNSVTFGGVAATNIVVVSPTTLRATSPAGTDTVDIIASNLYGPGLAVPADQFSYGPLVTKVTPTAGSGGGNTHVTISGHNFTGATDVSFGGQSVTPLTVNGTGTAITAISPPQDGSGVQAVDVTVSGPDGTSPIVPGDVFTYAAPVLTKITPTSGPAGGNTRVTISGKYLYGATDVTFGGMSAPTFTVNATGTAVTATAPPQAGTGVQAVAVAVTTSAGTATLPGAFTYLAPTVTSMTPTSGPAGGGTTVTIVGTNLYGTPQVTFGGVPGTITTLTNTSMKVVTPPGSGSVPVVVATSAGSATVPTTFTYL
jgi:hypothetical protein